MFRLFFRLPWFAYLLLGLGALGIGAYSFQNAKTMNSHRVQALAGEPPELIDASGVNEASFSPAEEINVSSQISQDTFTVSVSGRRTIDKSKVVVFALPEAASSTSDPVKAVYMLDTKYNVGDFISKFATQQQGALSPVVNVNGVLYNPGSKLARSVSSAASSSNLTLSPDVQYIEPFFNGREQGLTMQSPTENLGFFAAIASVLGGMSLFKLFFSKRRGKSVQPVAASRGGDHREHRHAGDYSDGRDYRDGDGRMTGDRAGDRATNRVRDNRDYRDRRDDGPGDRRDYRDRSA